MGRLAWHSQDELQKRPIGAKQAKRDLYSVDYLIEPAHAQRIARLEKRAAKANWDEARWQEWQETGRCERCGSLRNLIGTAKGKPERYRYIILCEDCAREKAKDEWRKAHPELYAAVPLNTKKHIFSQIPGKHLHIPEFLASPTREKTKDNKHMPPQPLPVPPRLVPVSEIIKKEEEKEEDSEEADWRTFKKFVEYLSRVK